MLNYDVPGAPDYRGTMVAALARLRVALGWVVGVLVIVLALAPRCCRILPPDLEWGVGGNGGPASDNGTRSSAVDLLIGSLI